MKIFRFALRSVNDGVSCRFHQPHSVRTLSSYVRPGGRMDEKQNSNPFESADDFEARIFSKTSDGNSKTNAFFAKLDKLGKPHDGGADKKRRPSFSNSALHFDHPISSKTSRGNSKTDSFSADLFGLKKTGDGYASNLPGGNGSGSNVLDGLDESFNTLSDGMDGKLKSAAKYFQYDSEEVEREDFEYRPDARFLWGGNYEVKDIDLTRSANPRPPKRNEFEVTTKEVLQKADFRNVRFLANFITEAGVIIKRSQTKISAKAQRKVAREIKTARAFGLMPFTTMGTKSFVFGKTMENLDADFEYESFDNPTADDGLGY